jgi:hypothetical protein
MRGSFTCGGLWGIVCAPDQEARLLVEVFAGSILANFVTITVIYGLWRLTKNERDIGAMGICLACFAAIFLTGLALRS